MNKTIRVISIVFLAIILVMYFQLAISRSNKTSAEKGSHAKHHMQIIYSNPNTCFFSEFHRGARAAEAELDIYVEFIEADKWETAGVLYSVRKGIHTGADGVAFSLNDRESITKMITTADSFDTQLILYQGDYDGTQMIPTIGVNAYQIGYKAGTLALETFSGNCKIAVVIDSMLSAEASGEGSMQLEGILSALNGVKNAVITGIYPLEVDVMRGQKMANSLLSEPNNFNVIICLNELTTAIIARRMEDLGLSDIKIIGYGAVPLTIKYIEQGSIYASLFPDAYSIGYGTVSSMSAMLSGEMVVPDSYIELLVIDKTNVSDFIAEMAAAD